MEYTRIFSVDTFPWWSGAKDVIKVIAEAKRIDELGAYIEDYYCGQTPSITEVNDFVWFSIPETDEFKELFQLTFSKKLV